MRSECNFCSWIIVNLGVFYESIRRFVYFFANSDFSEFTEKNSQTRRVDPSTISLGVLLSVAKLELD